MQPAVRRAASSGHHDAPDDSAGMKDCRSRDNEKEEFVNAVGASYNLVSLLAATLTSYILIGVFATYCELWSI
jgi:hypothetical protein